MFTYAPKSTHILQLCPAAHLSPPALHAITHAVGPISSLRTHSPTWRRHLHLYAPLSSFIQTRHRSKETGVVRIILNWSSSFWCCLSQSTTVSDTNHNALAWDKFVFILLESSQIGGSLSSGLGNLTMDGSVCQEGSDWGRWLLPWAALVWTSSKLEPQWKTLPSWTGPPPYIFIKFTNAMRWKAFDQRTH